MTEKGNRMTKKEWNDEEGIKQNEGVKGADEFLWVPMGSYGFRDSSCESLRVPGWVRKPRWFREPSGTEVEVGIEVGASGSSRG